MTNENLNTVLTTATKKDPHERTKLEMYVCDLAANPNPKKLDQALLLTSKTFYEVADKREKIVKAKANGAPPRVIEVAGQECDELFDNATTMVTVLALFGRKFWS